MSDGEHFVCEKLSCLLSTSSCAKRYECVSKLTSNQKWDRGLTMHPEYARSGGSRDTESKGIQLISCRGCIIGAENLVRHGSRMKKRRARRKGWKAS